MPSRNVRVDAMLAARREAERTAGYDGSGATTRDGGGGGGDDDDLGTTLQQTSSKDKDETITVPVLSGLHKRLPSKEQLGVNSSSYPQLQLLPSGVSSTGIKRGSDTP